MGLTAQGLRDIVVGRLGGGKLIAVSNREPYVHRWVDGEARAGETAGGLVTALEPAMRAVGGTWIAHGSGEADRAVVDEHDRVAVPPDDPKYQLRRVWLTDDEVDAYYYGFANRALWPLCHQAFTRPHFDARQYRTYKAVNRRFADAVLEEAGDDPAWVFVQDYHFALLPRMLKEARPDLVVAQFWHIPWPHREAFEICPWAEEILDGMLGNDLLGFHTRQHCNNFMETVDRLLESMNDYEELSIARRDHVTQVRAFPISVDCQWIAEEAHQPRVGADVERLRAELGIGDICVGVGVDRLDYTKGIPERFLAIERFLEKYPEYHGHFAFLQIGPESRVEIAEYQALVDEMEAIAERVNERFTKHGRKPIHILKENYPRDALLAFFRLCELCIVSSLHDGMNLVAKEFVCARQGGDGVLLLSRFTGASRELGGAVMINPYDTEAFAESIREALQMPKDERRRRMDRMCQALAENNIYDWAASVVTEISRLEGA